MGRPGRSLSRTTGAAGGRGAAPAARAAALAALCALALPACSLLVPRTVSICAWSPAVASPDPAGLAIWVEFTSNMDETSAEQAFTLTEDGSPARGAFSWTGRRLAFQPVRALSSGRDYVLSVDATAEDLSGVSLDRAFRFAFSTRSAAGRPAVLSVQPAPGSTVDDRACPIVVQFSGPMDSASVLRAFRVSPAVAGSLSLSADRAVLAFAPAARYDWQTEYTVTVGTTATSEEGVALAEERSWRFFVGSDRTPPLLLEARCHDGVAAGGLVAAIDDPGAPGLVVTGGWESTWGFQLSFSEPVSRESLARCVSLEPVSTLSILPGADWSQVFVVTPGQRLPWDAICTLTVSAGVTDMSGNRTAAESAAHVRTDGSLSRPPRVVLVRFRGTPVGAPARPVDFDPAAPLAALPVSADDFPVGVVLLAWFDLHLALADGASLDLLSAAEHFTAAASAGCLSVAGAGVQASGFDDPQPAAVAGAVALRVHVTIVNEAASGTVTIGLAEGFADSRGNPLAADWLMHFLK